MAKKRTVSMLVDEKFFKTFERERQREQMRLRRKLGEMYNLSQRNFTAMLAAKKFRFQILKQRPLVRKKRKTR